MFRYKKLTTSICLAISLVLSGYLTAAKPQRAVSDFTLKTINGDTVSLSDFRGQKVLIDFWATWCPPCLQELVEINHILNEFPGDHYTILLINVDNDIEAPIAYINKMGYSKMMVLHDNKGVAQSYGVRGIPSLFLVNKEGQLIWSHVGMADKETLIGTLGLRKAVVVTKAP